MLIELVSNNPLICILAPIALLVIIFAAKNTKVYDDGKYKILGDDDNNYRIKYKKNKSWFFVKAIGDIPQEFKSINDAKQEIQRFKDIRRSQDFWKE